MIYFVLYVVLGVIGIFLVPFLDLFSDAKIENIKSFNYHQSLMYILDDTLSEEKESYDTITYKPFLCILFMPLVYLILVYSLVGFIIRLTFNKILNIIKHKQ